MLQVFNSLLDANKREIGRLEQIVAEINTKYPPLKRLSDKQLAAKTVDFRKRLAKGQTLDQILPEAFAVVKEAFRRVEKIELHDVQLMAAITVHKGRIAEQKTGEGKTFSVVPAVYLNALEGKGVHVITVNDYLARRDSGWVAPVLDLLGLTIASIIHDQSFIYDRKFKQPKAEDARLKHLKPVSRKEAYAADVTYGTNNEYGFDYLRDNSANRLENQVQRGHHYAIVDEVDSILIDEARTPLIISMPDIEPTDKYLRFTKIINTLDGESDYVVDEKRRSAHLTDHGIAHIEKALGVENLYENDFSTLHHMEQALQAKALFKKDKDYVVRDGEIVIVDEFTGRLMPGRRYSQGLHQAIEAKEGVTIQQESKTLATVSFQNYFRMYQKLAGMTGTAATEAEEFHKIYKLDVVVIPTHIPVARKDIPDAIYKTIAAKYTAVADEIAEIHAAGQPVLVGTTSIEKNEFLSDLLKRRKISHAVLNAKNHEKEAEIIAQAGQKGAVTVATNLAGRGVDIKLGKGVNQLGGLYVIGTERHESRRIDNQLRGRSGRQGDNGTSKFFVSLEDDLMRIFGGEQVAKLMTLLKVPEDMPIENGMVSKALEGAQKKVEGHNFDQRKHTVEYDDVMNQQRKIIYGVRQQILEIVAGKSDQAANLKEDILNKVDTEISRIVIANSSDEINFEAIINEFATIISFDHQSLHALHDEIKKLNNAETITEYLTKLARQLYSQKEAQIGEEASRQIETMIYLHNIDQLWIEHLDTIDDLRSGIGLRAYAQRDPLVEYKREAFDLFDKLIATIDSQVVHQVFKANLPTYSGNIINAPAPAVDMSKAVEVHQEALDETKLVQNLEAELAEAEKKLEPSKDTKVTIERAGSTPVTIAANEKGNLKSAHPKLGRNDPCWCGSGKKYKKCHLSSGLA